MDFRYFILLFPVSHMRAKMIIKQKAPFYSSCRMTFNYINTWWLIVMSLVAGRGVNFFCLKRLILSKIFPAYHSTKTEWSITLGEREKEKKKSRPIFQVFWVAIYNYPSPAFCCRHFPSWKWIFNEDMLQWILFFNLPPRSFKSQHRTWLRTFFLISITIS